MGMHGRANESTEKKKRTQKDPTRGEDEGLFFCCYADVRQKVREDGNREKEDDEEDESHREAREGERKR